MVRSFPSQSHRCPGSVLLYQYQNCCNGDEDSIECGTCHLRNNTSESGQRLQRNKYTTYFFRILTASSSSRRMPSRSNTTFLEYGCRSRKATLGGRNESNFSSLLLYSLPVIFLVNCFLWIILVPIILGCSGHTRQSDYFGCYGIVLRTTPVLRPERKHFLFGREQNYSVLFHFLFFVTPSRQVTLIIISSVCYCTPYSSY